MKSVKTVTLGRLVIKVSCCKPNAAAAFAREIDVAIALITENPERGLLYLEGTRRILLKRFPFQVVFRVQGKRIQVVAVAHGRRRPGYWSGRLARE